MPNKQTFTIKPIRELLLDEIHKGKVLDPFGYSGTLKKLLKDKSEVTVIDNDLNENFNTDYHMDARDFLKMFADNSIDIVVYDPPYSPRQVQECYNGIGKVVTAEETKMSFWSIAKDEIARVLKTNGKAICFGWSSQGIGKNRGFKMENILLVPHGGNKNDTICTVETKGEY